MFVDAVSDIVIVVVQTFCTAQLSTD